MSELQLNMTSTSFKNQLEGAIPLLLNLVKKLTWNKLSDNLKFILTEIKDSQENFYEQRRLRKIENDKKIPVTLQELMPVLQELYVNFYDVNLYIYKATRKLTVIDIRYYPKSSLDEVHRLDVINKPTMLHCKVSTPPWLSDKKEKFDINWEHSKGWNKWKLFWLKLKLKTQRG